MELKKKSGKYLGQSDFEEDGDWYTVSHVTTEMLEDKDSGTSEEKYVLFFVEFEKGMILGVGTLEALCTATGTKESTEMKGKKVNVYVDPNVTHKGKVTGGVRIRKKAFKG